MFSLEVIPGDDDGEEVLQGEKQVEPVVEKMNNSYPYISLNALSGITTYNTMRVKGFVGNQVLHILID